MISDVYEAMKALPSLADLEKQTWLGSEYLDLNEPAPRVVWVPTTTSFRPGKHQTGPGAIAAGQPRALYTANAGVDVHLWAKSLGTTDTIPEIRALELMAMRIVSALRSIAYGSFELGGFLFSAQGSEPLAQYGRHGILKIVLSTPMLEQLGDSGETKAKILTEANTAGFGGVPVPVNLP